MKTDRWDKTMTATGMRFRPKVDMTEQRPKVVQSNIAEARKKAGYMWQGAKVHRFRRRSTAVAELPVTESPNVKRGRRMQ